MKDIKTSKDKGMTILEVMMAFVILMIGVGFMMVSNKAYFAFREDRQDRQQMIYYAAGQMEALLEEKTVSFNDPPFDDYGINVSITDYPSNAYLEIVHLEVYKKGSPTDPEPVSIYTYRVKIP